MTFYNVEAKQKKNGAKSYCTKRLKNNIHVYRLGCSRLAKSCDTTDFDPNIPAHLILIPTN